MSRPDYGAIRDRLSQERIAPYEQSTAGDLPLALDLYCWNGRISAALFEVVGLAEVAARNAMAEQLAALGRKRGWPEPWYRGGRRLFSAEDLRDIDKAVERATGRGRKPEVPGKVIAELNFGFWRFLASRRHHTSLWVPGLHAAFGNLRRGPSSQSRNAAFRRMEDINVLRNRIAHHEPIHQRDVVQDEARMLEFIGWISADVARWAEEVSRVRVVAGERPS